MRTTNFDAFLIAVLTKAGLECAQLQKHDHKGAAVYSSKTFLVQIIVLTVLGISIPSVLAQSASTSALTGRVTDPTAAVLPGVMVTATAVATNQVRTAITAEDGV